MGLQALSLVAIQGFGSQLFLLVQESNLPSKAWQAAPQTLPFSVPAAFAHGTEQVTLA